ncbi:MAG TPA: chorismate mutase [Chitinispirillaceae bacterium]|nr:chorismate mutase [Chitinispirillaceae bacterium]
MSENSLHLSYIAARLEALEETIIYKLLDRAQFAINKNAYLAGHSGFSGNVRDSLFDIRLASHETMDAEFGRFSVPEERPFNRNLPQSKRKVSIDTSFLSISDFNLVNLCTEIKAAYLDLLQRLCPQDDDAQYGSSVEHDVFAVQSISRRIHYGSFYVAECKFRSAPGEYTSMIKCRDHNALLDKLTRKDVEEQIINRIFEKICSIQRDVNKLVRQVIDPQIIVTFYRDTVIPLTKEGEILYLMNRRL